VATTEVATTASDEAVGTKRRVEAPARKAKPVKYWAVVGAFFLALQAYVYGAWILSGDATATPHGPNEPPDWMLVAIRTQEVLAPLGLLVFAYFFLYRPWRRDRRIGLDGLMVLCALGVWWQDPLVNYTQTFATYNSFYLNLGSWTEQVPGWMSPNGSNFSEPLLWTGPAYVWGMLGGVIVANKFMAKVKGRWPQTGTLGIIVAGFGFFVFFDTLFELAFMRLGVYTYPGAHQSLSFFGGNFYQFPVYEALLWGATWTGFACVRFFRNDKGETVAERGIDEVRATPKQKTFIRFLALLGIWSSIFMAYNVSWAWIALNQSAWPADITQRSYFTDMICGPGTKYACPGPKIPIPRPGSDFVDVDGKLARPN
jgi:hypothetical protein